MPDFAEIRSSDKDTTHGPGLDEVARGYGANYPKAVASLRRDEELLLTFFDFPAEHWVPSIGLTYRTPRRKTGLIGGGP